METKLASSPIPASVRLATLSIAVFEYRMGSGAGDITELKQLRRIGYDDGGMDLVALAKTRNTWADISVLRKTRSPTTKPAPQLLQHEPQLETFKETSDEDTTTKSECGSRSDAASPTASTAAKGEAAA